MSHSDRDDETTRQHRDDDVTDRDRVTDHDEHEIVDNRPNPRERGKWISAVIGLLGVWMIVQAIGLDLLATQFWNDVAVGILLLAVGAYNYMRRADERLGSTAAAAVAALVGVWLIAAPFVLGADTGATETVNDLGFWNDIVVGLLALGLGVYSAYTARDQHRDVRRRTAT